jgi:hypothetical protein
MNFKKIENEDEFAQKVIEESEKLPRSVFTYAVNMIVSVFADDEDAAQKQLDENGGFVSYRTVELKDAIEIYKPEED